MVGKKNKRNEFVNYVMISLIFIITLFGCINIYKSCKIINNQAEANLVYLAEDIKQKGNDYFRVAEEEVEHCKSTIEFTIDYEKLKKQAPTANNFNKYKIPYFGTYLDSTINPLFLQSINKIKNLVSIYFILDPHILPNKEVLGLWYTNSKSDRNFKITDNGKTSEMYPENSDDLQWFYRPKELKNGTWSDPYIDKDLKTSMITYSSPIYSQKKFIGVIGVDIETDEIKNFISKFKIYKTGKAYLINKENKTILTGIDNGKISTDIIDKGLYSFLDKIGKIEGPNLKYQEIQIIKSSTHRVFAITELYNGFILVLEVPTKELYAETIKLIIFASYLLLLVVLIISLITIEANANIQKINNSLMHKEKLISLGTIVSEIAHEVNNPIGFVSCNLETLKKFIAKIKILLKAYDDTLIKMHSENNLTPEAIEIEYERIKKLKTELKTDYIIEALDELIDESKEGIQRVSEIVVNLKNFAKDDSRDIKTSENLDKIITDSLTFINGKIKPDVDIIMELNAAQPLTCNKNQLSQVLINLLDNANYSLEKKGHPNKKIRISTYKKGGYACIEIEDNGLGIDKTTIDRVFDPFFSTKPQGEGTGLGLSIAYDIITKKHKGEFLVESIEGSRTKFTIKIPY